MHDCSESVHVHRMDADSVIEEYRQKGYTLKERTKPTIPAQIGFERLVFVPTEFVDPETPPCSKLGAVEIRGRATSYLKYIGRKLKAD